jgi:predicted nucleic acid-binding protein
MICFDTMPIIWGVQGAASQGQGEMIARTMRYIEHLREQRKRIMIPAPALTEYLLAFTPNEQKEQRRVIERNFFVAAYDIPAVEVAAELLGNKELIQEMRKTGNYDKMKVSIDAQIVAIAIVNKAEKIISHDPGIAKIAQGKIPVEHVPVIHTQLDIGFE